ncbi:hypothetical protein R1sor_005637 [Riccia sorocarpa]|uniref:E3 ubiquitin protein ligase n=1 Tax=Riccia sorocarpa TaxID=122646 RepID=A0ABD3HMG7_9MARC
MGSTEEPERKRRHLNDNTVSPPLKKQPMAPPSEEKKVDAGVLQYQNTKLAQQLDVQRTEIHALEEKFTQLKSKQASYDDTLIAVNRVWKELVVDLELFAIKANAPPHGLRVLEPSGTAREKVPTQPPEQTFLHRLLETGATESSTSACDSKSVEAALAFRRASTVKTMTNLVQAMDVQRSKTEDLASSLRERLSSDEAGWLLKRADEELRAESAALHKSMEQLHLKYKQIAAEIGLYKDAHAKDQSEIARLNGELEESAGELETSRRKLAALRSQKESVAAPTTPTPQATSKSEHGEKAGADKVTKETRELEASLEEAKTLAARRLTELQEALQTQLNLSQKLQHMQDLLGEEQSILTSRPYLLLNDQVQAAKNEVEKYRTSYEQLQVERDTVIKRERELILKMETFEAARKSYLLANSRIAELETQLQQCMAEKDNLQLRLDESAQVKGKNETVSEFKAMVTCLHKEMGMMQNQLNKYKEAAHEVHSLRAEVYSLATICERKALWQSDGTKVGSTVCRGVKLRKSVRLAIVLYSYFPILEIGPVLDVASARAPPTLQQLSYAAYSAGLIGCSFRLLKAPPVQTAEYQALSELYAGRLAEVTTLKEEVVKLQESEQELKLILEMHGRESSDPRDVMELQEAECRAWAQVERLKAALNEHSLELRVKAANEAEAACQQRLTAAEADIAVLRQQLVASERMAMELQEALKAKNEEGDAYISEIETIGQAYEDMQTQNQRLLQQLTERDDYNTQLVGESLKAKQALANLESEKQMLVRRFEQAHASVDLQKQRIARHEEQARLYLEQLNKATDESRLHTSALDNARRRTAEVEKEVVLSKAALEAAQKTVEERGDKIVEIQGELEKERFEKRRVQEELDALNTKVSRLTSYHDGNPLVERLQEELKEYRAILKCSVCHDRAKEVVITKCYHLFCGPCIQRNLELRHRKCPGCGVPFGQNDVRTVYI